MSSDVFVKTEGITKQFPGVTALNNVTFDIRSGEILSIVGENGAGKSTLMNILSGVYAPTSGTISFNGVPTRFKDPFDAQKHGIAMIHQELSVAPKLSVMENIFIGRLCKTKLGLVDYKTMRLRCKKQLEILCNDSIQPDQMVSELSTSQRQVVEIAKALSLNAKLVIMDEPTSSLSKSETESLLGIIKGLSQKGVSVLFISHKMDEVFAISDRIAVFRDGEYINTLNRNDTNPDEIISLMVGRTFIHTFKREHNVFGIDEAPILEIKNLNSSLLKNINLKIHKGEVLVLTGLVGAGRTELLQTIFGIEKYNSCEFYLEGKRIQINNPTDAKRFGFGLIPEGRKLTGLFMNMSVLANETICVLDQISKALIINNKKDRQKGEKISAQLAVKTPNLDQKIKYLSGGNQQKCIIGRWLLTNPKILFMDEPTHGIDVGAKAEIYKIIDNLAKEGVSILMVSSELPEVLALADRILVMKQGEIVADIQHAEASSEVIMQHAVIMKKTYACS